MSVYQDQYHLPAFDYGSYEKIKIEQDGRSTSARSTIRAT